MDQLDRRGTTRPENQAITLLGVERAPARRGFDLCGTTRNASFLGFSEIMGRI